MPSSIQSDAQLRWNPARRNRNRLRYLVRERVKEEAELNVPSGVALGVSLGASSIIRDVKETDIKSKEDNTIDSDICSGDHSHYVGYDRLQEESLKPFLDAITHGKISFFSLQVFSSQSQIISKPFPTQLLLSVFGYKIQTLCYARFGREYTSSVFRYLKYINHITMMEYATLIGEYGVAKGLVSGGINPSDLLLNNRLRINRYKKEECDDFSHINDYSNEKIEVVASKVMKKLVVDFVPASLAVYIAKKFYELRLLSIDKQIVNNDSSNINVDNMIDRQECEICSIKGCLINFPPCNHIFCEICLWDDLVSKLDERTFGDVVQCPTCNDAISNEHYHGLDECDAPNITTNELMSMDPKSKREYSLNQFRILPKTSNELRNLLPRKRNMKKKIYSSWSNALKSMIGSSQDVRSDKFNRYVDCGAIHHCRACLEGGVDVNMTNEYNQTPLYIACWKNHVDIVRLLLDWGADTNIHANGLLSVTNVARENNNDEVLQVFNELLCKNNDVTRSIRDRMVGVVDKSEQQKQQLTTLIRDESHPGNGAFFIDHLLNEDTMKVIDELFNSTPVADTTEVKQKKIDNNIPCSLRHYFCDAEGYLCNLISSKVKTVLLAMSDKTAYRPSDVYVFPQMRFLNYNQPGGVLLPHIDLTKTDASTGQRSTHTFILYTRNCEAGGETAMLKKLSDPKDYHEIIEPAVCPRRSRLLVFPHACPHQGMKVISTPKILLRGEIILK